jgi:RNA polymerase sigma factor (sigma-70 family)
VKELGLSEEKETITGANTRGKKAWTLGQHAFELLLARLDPDRDRAGLAYEHLRQTLVTFFDWRGCFDPEDLADETFNRVARRLEEGEDVRSLPDYCYGVARRLALEVLPKQSRLSEAAEEFKRLPVPASNVEERIEREKMLEQLERCLGQLTAENRDLIISYYQTEKRAKIDNRVALASALGINLNGLRVRVHRLRAKIEECISKSMGRR